MFLVTLETTRVRELLSGDVAAVEAPRSPGTVWNAQAAHSGDWLLAAGSTLPLVIMARDSVSAQKPRLACMPLPCGLIDCYFAALRRGRCFAEIIRMMSFPSPLVARGVLPCKTASAMSASTSGRASVSGDSIRMKRF